MNQLRISLVFVFFLSIASLSAADTPLVSHSDLWRYRKGSAGVLPADWKTAPDSGLDSTWFMGNGGLGYADNTAETSNCQTLLPDMRNSYTTVAYRKEFQVSSSIDPTLRLVLTMDFDDGFIAWLDGVYLTSANSPGAPAQPGATAVATALHESSRGGGSPEPPAVYDLGAVDSRLGIGSHVLAIVGLNESASSSDFIQIADLTTQAAAPAPTNCLSGPIATDMTLFATNSPYAICGALTIERGATLTIEPGTTVGLDRGVYLTVADGGRLLAEGTPEAPILFTRSPNNTGRWAGIVISGSAGSPETRLAHAEIEFNGAVAVHSQGGTVYLDHLTFGSPDRQYVALDSSSFLVSHCYFPSSASAFELVHGTGGIKAGGRGIVRDNFFGTTSGYNDIIDFTGGNRPNQPIIQFFNNVFTGATDDILDLDGTDAWIEGNIFLHAHKNGAPDSSAAVSGGNNGGNTSEVTMIGNIFFDCDQAATAKQGNFYTMINNTMVRMTKLGGLDTAAGAVNVRDLDPGPPTTFGAGFFLEGNIIVDAEQLVRNYEPGQTSVTFKRNILPMPWTGPGEGNIVADPMLKHIPQLSETVFTNWTDAQILRDWFSLLPGSAGVAAGPNGLDMGGVIPLGASISGGPIGTTTETNASLRVGVNRIGNGIPSSSWTKGAGYTNYRWRLDAGAWSAETSIDQPIVLTNLANGAHQVEVSGQRDSGMFQDDPELGQDAVITRSIWTVQSGLQISSARISGNDFVLEFTAKAGQSYAVEYRTSLDSPVPWQTLTNVPAETAARQVQINEPIGSAPSARFYRIVQP